MLEIYLHKDAQKALSKAPRKLQKKFLEFSEEYSISQKSLFPIAPMKGKYRIYLETKIDKDYRILFRIEENKLLIRYAGTHNDLRTG